MLKRLVVFVMLSSTAFAQEASKPAGEGADTHHVPATNVKQLTNQEFDTYVAHPEQVLLLDVRRPDEISSMGGFPVYLSIQAKDLKNHLGEIPKDRPIITVSNHAARASVAADLLESNGFRVLGAVGADTYQKSGGTLAVKFPVPPATQGNRPSVAGSNSQPTTPGSN